MTLRASEPIPIVLGTAPLGGNNLGFVPLKQEQNEWCWATCLQMLLVKNGDSSKHQCDFADAAFSLTGCCLAPSSSLCDQPLDTSQFVTEFSRYNFSSTYLEKSVPFNTVQSEIEAARPLQVGIAWTGGGGHAVLITGFVQQGVEQFVVVVDPADGSSSQVHYDDFLTASGRGVWQWTWTGIKKPG